MLDDASVFLSCTRHEPRNINKGDQRNLECITESNESCCFHGGVNVEASSKDLRLVTYNSDNFTFHFCEADDDVLGVVRHDFKEFVSVSDVFNDFKHVVSFVRVLRHNVV